MDLVLSSMNHDYLPLAVLIIECVHIKEVKSSFCWEQIKFQFLILAITVQRHILLQSKHRHTHIFIIVHGCLYFVVLLLFHESETVFSLKSKS